MMSSRRNPAASCGCSACPHMPRGERHVREGTEGLLHQTPSNPYSQHKAGHPGRLASPLRPSRQLPGWENQL